MNTDEQFKQKFNELDQICKKLYPAKAKTGFASMREFANSLSSNDKNTLTNLISSRNTHTHDDRVLFHFDAAAVRFLQGLIDGANRKLHNGLNSKIDPTVENLRSANLKEMGQKLFYLDSTLYSLSDNQKNNVKQELKKYIDNERKAVGLEAVKKEYFDFLSRYNQVVKQEKSTRYKKGLENEKNDAINAVESMYRQVIAETTIFNISKRKNAKHLLESGINSINRCKDFNALSKCLDDLDDAFNSLFE